MQTVTVQLPHATVELPRYIFFIGYRWEYDEPSRGNLFWYKPAEKANADHFPVLLTDKQIKQKGIE